MSGLRDASRRVNFDRSIGKPDTDGVSRLRSIRGIRNCRGRSFDYVVINTLFLFHYDIYNRISRRLVCISCRIIINLYIICTFTRDTFHACYFGTIYEDAIFSIIRISRGRDFFFLRSNSPREYIYE